MLKKITTLLFALILTATPLLTTAADARQTAIDESLTYYKTDLKPYFELDSTNTAKLSPSVWTMLVLYVTGNVNNADYAFLKPDVNVSLLNSESGVNDYASAIISLYAGGLDATNASSRNLADELAALVMSGGEISDSLSAFELAMAVFALEMAKNTKYDKNKAVQFFADARLTDGGFNDYGDKGDVDTTAIIIMALTAIRTAATTVEIEKSFEFLKSIQENDGFFLAKHEYGSKNAAAQAMAILALTAAGEKLSDWDKNGKSVIDALLTLKGENGGFWNTAEAKAGDDSFFKIPDNFSTAYAILALSAALKEKTVFEQLLPAGKYTKPVAASSVAPSSPASSAAVTSEKPNPATGDQMKMLPWIIVIVLAVVAIAAVIFLGKGKKK